MALATGRLTTFQVFCGLGALGAGPGLVAFVWQFPWGPAALLLGGALVLEVTLEGWAYWRRIDQLERDDF